MSGIAGLTSRLVISWATAYTVGLPPTAREARRMEIASDLWEQHRAEAGAGWAQFNFAVSLLSRMVRGIPADVLWRVNVEGPKVDIRIPFERALGVLLLAMVVLAMITASISGYDTRASEFEPELRRLAGLSTTADNLNAVVRAITGFGLIAGAAGLYVALRDRARRLSVPIAFGMCAAGVLELVAGALQLVLVELAEEFVTSEGAHQEQVLVTARAFAIAVQQISAVAFFTLMLSTYTLAFVTARESLVPRWSLGIPALGAVLIGASIIGGTATDFDGAAWAVLMAGLLSSALWLIFAGLWMLFSPTGARAASGPARAAA